MQRIGVMIMSSIVHFTAYTTYHVYVYVADVNMHSITEIYVYIAVIFFDYFLNFFRILCIVYFLSCVFRV